MTEERSAVVTTAPESRLGDGLRHSLVGAAHSLGSLRLPEFVLFFGLIAHELLPIPDTPVPMGHALLVVIILLALFRRPVIGLGAGQVLIPVLTIGLFYVGVVSMFATPSEFAASWQERLVRMAAVTVLLGVMASGRIDMRSAMFGYFSALVLNVPLFYAGLVPDTYGGYLTGLVGDKNAAGFQYAVVGLIMLGMVSNQRARVLLAAFSATAVWLTGSRTSIAAFGAGVAWLLLAPYLPVVGKWLLGGFFGLVLEVISEDYSRVGVFSDRLGSDLLRERIDAASQIKYQEAGFFGHGLGEAYVFIEDRTWFFHNSYWSALAEGGWPWTVLVVGATVLVTVRPFSGAQERWAYIPQAAGIGVLICATRLGEVFYTNAWAFVMALGLSALAAGRSPDVPDTGQRPESEGAA